MRLSHVFVLRLVLLPTAVWGQSVASPSITPTRLIGTWASEMRPFLILRPDSTFGWDYEDPKTFAHWRSLHGDTIVLRKEPGYRITLKDDALLMLLTPLGSDYEFGTHPQAHDALDKTWTGTYRRLDASSPLPQQFVTGLLGTWVCDCTDYDGYGNGKGKADTVTFRPDSTTNWRVRPKTQFSHWYHLRGDTLWTPSGPFPITLTEQQLVITNRDGYKAVYHRLGGAKPAP